MTLPQTVFFQFLIQIDPVYCTYILPKNQTYNVASAPTVTGSVFLKGESRLFFGQCTLYSRLEMMLYSSCFPCQLEDTIHILSNYN